MLAFAADINAIKIIKLIILAAKLPIYLANISV
jgi:hypothetical protein